MNKVRYRWTEDGDAEICTAEETVLDHEERCYHCNGELEQGETVIRLQAEDGDVYLIHRRCYHKSCEN